MIGEMLGPYRVLEKIGAGGMGEVYKARDTRLDRTVAIKVLPPDVSADPERRTRFEREAKTIAGLNHPHICTLHDVGEHDGSTFLVMEHIAGQTLAQRLEKGPLPVEQALTVATEIAEALSAAHRQGVIHRDLKPANVMLTKTGAKLLDFGLAKLTGHGEQPAASYAASAVPTQAATLTGQGVIVGTLQYMAPEQLEGKPPDARTDLWALGAILYEMVTGKRAFDGTSAVSLMAAIMDQQPPPIASLQPLTPPALDHLVQQCLAKLPDERPDTAHDVANDLRRLRAGSGPALGSRSATRSGRREAMAWLLLAMTMVGAGVGWFRKRPSSPASVVPIYATFPLTTTPTVFAGQYAPFAISPNGDVLVFKDGNRLVRRALNGFEVTPLEGTEDPMFVAFSPDGTALAVASPGRIRRVPLSSNGGPSDLLTRSVGTGLTWGEDDRIYFSAGFSGGIWRLPAVGGAAPEPVTRVDQSAGEGGHAFPQLLPGRNGNVGRCDVPRGIGQWDRRVPQAEPTAGAGVPGR